MNSLARAWNCRDRSTGLVSALARHLILAAVLLSVVALGACGDDDGPTADETPPEVQQDVQAAIDRILAENGFRSDGDNDGVVDALDRYPGDDYGDDDRDGWANWIDLAPQESSRTVPPAATQYQTPDQVADAQERAIHQKNAEILAGNGRALEVINQQLDREAKDQDTDGIPDLYDPQTYMRFGGDDDNDDTPNGRDVLPLNPGYE
jgi:hypothetical protein